MTSNSAKVAKQLKQLGRAVNPPQQQDFDDGADHRDDQRGGEMPPQKPITPPILVAKLYAR